MRSARPGPAFWLGRRRTFAGSPEASGTGQVAAVDRQHRPREISRFVRLEVDAAPRDVLGDAEVRQRDAALEPVARGGVCQQLRDALAALDEAGGDRVHPDAALRVA